MESHRGQHAECHRVHQSSESCGVPPRSWGRRLLRHSPLAGLAALVWLLLRSGTKPSRLSYPCQQAAFSTASLAFAAPLIAAVYALRRRLAAGLHTTVGVVVAALAVMITIGVGGYMSIADEPSAPAVFPPLDYRAQLFHVTNCPQDPAGEHFVGLDRLIALMGRDGQKFYKSASVSPTAGPSGVVAANDVVIIKINYQWPERGGTNTDLLRGLVRRILDHPDAFTGEVVVCENAQFNSTSNLDRSTNNAQDHALSPHDVVVGFQSQGYPVSQYDWTPIRDTSVAEYSAGNMTDGYVVLPYNAQIQARPSYPKFRTSRGTYVSLKYGVWNSGSASYDRARLKFINVPVLKSHHATYGATACVKHYMGVVTGNLSTDSHSAIGRGILGVVMGEIRPADLNILDCTWINANPNSGPATTYGGATRRDELIASLDPVATDMWAVKNILIPAFIANGYSPPWPTPSADPNNPSSAFRNYLDRSMSYLVAAGYGATNDLSRIDVAHWNGQGDLNEDGTAGTADFALLASCMNGPGVTVPPPGGDPTMFGRADLDADHDVDMADVGKFQVLFTGGA